jgi:transposase
LALGRRYTLQNNSAAREIDLGRKSWLFCGADCCGQRTAFTYTLDGHPKFKTINPLAGLADIFARIADITRSRLIELLPWNWCDPLEKHIAA